MGEARIGPAERMLKKLGGNLQYILRSKVCLGTKIRDTVQNHA